MNRLPLHDLMIRPPNPGKEIPRRTVLRGCLGTLALGVTPAPASFCSSSLSARDRNYRKLKTPVRLPRRAFGKLWRLVPFTARCEVSRGDPSSEILLESIALRLPGEQGEKPKITAFCLICPHEICNVKWETEPRPFPPGESKSVRADSPLFVCPCHFSVFDPQADGGRLAGPATRGLYRYRIEIGKQNVKILAVEEAALGS